MTCEEVREKLSKLGTVNGMLQCNLNLIKGFRAAPQKTLWQRSLRLFGKVFFWGAKTPPHTSLGEEK